MNIQAITLERDEPATITVTMTVTEAAHLGAAIGRTNYAARDELVPGWGETGSNIYDALVGGVFNRFYDDGLPEYLNGQR